MDTNTNNQQINTFVKGMNTDVSDSLINNDEYRLAKNVRYGTNTEENSGELRLIEGAVPFDGWKPENVDVDHIIATTSIRDYGVIVAKMKVTIQGIETTGWGVIRFTNANTKSPTLVFGACTDPIWDTDGDYKLSLVTRYEASDNVNLYIADGHHHIMMI